MYGAVHLNNTLVIIFFLYRSKRVFLHNGLIEHFKINVLGFDEITDLFDDSNQKSANRIIFFFVCRYFCVKIIQNSF